jgi:hypothetical protein
VVVVVAWVVVDVEPVVVVVSCVVVDVEPVVVVVVPCVVVDVEPVVVLVVVVLVVPPVTQMLASLRLSPGNEGPTKMSPGCFEWPLIQPLMLIEITTYGFFAEPVLWQISTFCPFVFSLPDLPAVFAEPLGADLFFGFDEARGAGWLEGRAAGGAGCEGFDFTFVFGAGAGFDFGFDFCFTPLLCPAAFPEFPRALLCEDACCDCGACGSAFCWPGAFSELPLPGFPATAAPANPAMQRTTSASMRQSPSFLRSTISCLPGFDCTVGGGATVERT